MKERFPDTLLAAGLAVVAISAASGWLVARLRDWARRRDLLDRPNARSSHSQPTPRLGGLAMVAVVSLPGLLWLEVAGRRDSPARALLLLGLIVALVSLLDDLRGLPARLRLGIHGLVACGVVASAGTLQAVSVPGLGTCALGLADWPLSVLWIVGCINAFNFMDGIDGLAGGQAVVLGLTWFAIGLLLAWPEGQVLGLLLASSAAGFLVHNWAPARIFMGDAGSAFLGYWAAVMPFCAPRPGALLAPAALALWPFLFDTSLTLARRARSGQPLLVAHRGHLYQRLVDSGYSHARVASLYIALATGGALAALLAALEHPRAPWAAALLPLAAGLLLWTVARQRRRNGPF